MSNVSSLNDRRRSVFYTVTIEHKWSGAFSFWITGVGDDPTPQSRQAIAAGLLEAIRLIDSSVLETAGSSVNCAANDHGHDARSSQGPCCCRDSDTWPSGQYCAYVNGQPACRNVSTADGDTEGSTGGEA